ncbi:hypothetical protein Q5424_26740 [Conexibacter sp. JD483]|uniref:hypothetical protein n=1 Tax=unclassified Conexibacter TaxID=2627773 RepID=UPI00271C13CF|nr:MULTISPECIES: hypothetical protein [unclassified Conexibacter]MDO8188023.1 hypothetical protein [Conexibacter sp. CPCC 205706]MDO8200906.1 hypothetical protein [Conexibacter sp. CPCC 205762]MDR9372726.1 hypothetical protein [Conexibacter sp. JD483]
MKRFLAASAAMLACALTAYSAVALATPYAGAGSDARDDGQSAQILYDCSTSRTGLLQRAYSVRVLRIALRELPGDVADYTGCPDAIRLQIEQATATVTATIRRAKRGSAIAGRVALLDRRGRLVDQLTVKRHQGANFRVVPGRYVVRANGKRRCSANVVAKRWRTAEATVVCR